MEIESFFENHKQIIENELLKANSSVLIAVAWINFKEYSSILDKLLDKKVQLQIICSDNSQNRSHKQIIDFLVNKGAEIKLLKMPHSKNHMHHKFAIIDNETILNGSFNWSPNATKSFENLMVIRNFEKEVSKFIEEFKKLKLIETATIGKLTKLCNCENCETGKIVNILVFSSKTSKHFETSGDIVKACTECDFFDNNNDIITNNQLFVLVDSFSSVDNKYEYEKINQLIFDELNQYINNGIIIHAIGQVAEGLNGFDEDSVQTNILWRNKFIGDLIPYVYHDQNFDVYYDHTSHL